MMKKTQAQNWLENARCEETIDETVDDWIQRATNDLAACVDDDGRIWTRGRWMTEAESLEIFAKIDRGV